MIYMPCLNMGHLDKKPMLLFHHAISKKSDRKKAKLQIYFHETVKKFVSLIYM